MKRLVICCDGTWQKVENPCPSNVVKITQVIKSITTDQISQIVFYNEGVGTEEYLIDKLGGGAFGWGIDHAIQNAYRFLCLNHEPGDEVYLFGFSRGAYTVRCLAGLIYNAGLLKRQHLRHISEAYELYRNHDAEASPLSEQAIQFKQQYGEPIKITLLACWDTVGSLGIPDVIPWLGMNLNLNQKYQFLDATLNPIVLHARHAMAVDEIRKVFNICRMEDPNGTIDVKERWFPGEHGCVGGGTESTKGLSNATLQWIMAEAAALGLEFDPEIQMDTGWNGTLIDHTTPFNNDPGVYKKLGTINRGLESKQKVNIQCSIEFDDLDDSVKKRWRDLGDYRPENLQICCGSLLDQWARANPL